MAFTHLVKQQYSVGGSLVTSTAASYSGNDEINVDDSVAAAQTHEYDVTLSKATVQSLLIFSDQPVIIKTNSSTVPQDTLTIAGGQSLLWARDHTETCPFSADVSKIFAVNGGSAVAKIKVRVLQNV